MSSVDIETRMGTIIDKLNAVFEENLEKDPRLSIQAAKELRGYLTELNSIQRGRTSPDDVTAMEIFRITKAVKKVGFAPSNLGGLGGGSFGDGQRRKRVVGGNKVCVLRESFSEEPEAALADAYLDDEPDPTP